MTYSEDFANITLHIVVIAVFIVIVFFTYGSYLEKNIIEKQMNYVAHDLVKDIKVLSPELDTMLKQKVGSIRPPDMTKEDNGAAEYNKKIIKNAIIASVIFTVFFLSIIIGVIRYNELNATKLLLQNSLSLLVIGVTYFMFSTFIVYNYRSAEPNFVKKTILETLQQFAQS